jgi:shikimate dehydrogenase
MSGAGTTLVEDTARIGAHQCWFDFVYHPRRTPFLEGAAARGAATVDGLALLVAQAALAFELWTGRTFDTAGMLSALEEEEHA